MLPSALEDVVRASDRRGADKPVIQGLGVCRRQDLGPTWGSESDSSYGDELRDMPPALLEL